jgi:transcriptional regulator with XRE-family HTH domain
MFEVNDRIKELRKQLNLTQTEFGDRLHVSRGVINNIDQNIVEPKPLFLDNVAATFNVNRLWLETGEGEMLADMSREEKIGRLIADILDDSPESFRRRVFEILVDLDAGGWKKLQDAAELLADKYGTKKDEG